MAYDPENNPYIPGDPASYDLKWVIDRLNEHKFAEESAADAKASAEAAEASAQEASGYADDAERYRDAASGFADDASGYADDAEGYRDEAADYAAHIADPVSGLVTQWLDDNITQPTTPVIDASLLVGGAAADAKAVGDRLLPMLSKTLKFSPCNFYGRVRRSATTPSTLNNENYSASMSSARYLSYYGPTIIELAPAADDLVFRVLDYVNGGALIDWTTGSYIVPHMAQVVVELRHTNAGSTDYVTTTDIDRLTLYTTEANYKYLFDCFYETVSETSKFGTYDLVDYITRYDMYEGDSQIGMLKRGANYYRTTRKAIISDHDMQFIVGHDGTNNNITVVINNTIINAIEGAKVDIPANTPAVVCFRSASTSPTNTIENATIREVLSEPASDKIIQYLSNVTTPHRSDAAFMVGDKLFSLGREDNQKYSVRSLTTGALLASNVSMDHTGGHANSCNYDNGYVYISDWTDGTLIHVFEVDADNNTMSYVKDISIPATDYGRIEYFVRNQEREIFFLGWQTGASSTVNNCLVWGLYILKSGGYELSYVRKAIRPEILQGFTVQDHYLYYVVVDTSYKTTYINRIDMITGTTEEFTATGTLTSYEAEAIMPIGKGSFYIVDVTGRLYFAAFPIIP